MAPRLATLSGPALAAALPAVARLRISVFREWPYLYDGTLAYEEKYLAEFAHASGAVIVAAYAGDDIVGAATAAPLPGHSPEFEPLFVARTLDPRRVFYFGESVLLPQWRGQGLGHRFFDAREAAARSARNESAEPYAHAAFCAVVRDEGDPRRPAHYTSLDAFWRKRGFAPVPGMQGSYSWKELGAAKETEHPMQFWLKALAP